MFQSHHQWFLPPTIGIRAPFIGKQKSFGVYPNFQSCQKQVLIIPQCRAHQDDLIVARISLIGAFGDPHAPSEDPVTVAHAQPRAPEVEAASSRLRRVESRVQPSHKPRHTPRRAEPPSSRSRAERIFLGIFHEYSPEYSRFKPANRPPFRIGFLTGSPIFGPDFNKVRPVPYYLDHSGSNYSVRLAKFGSQKGDIVIKRAK